MIMQAAVLGVVVTAWVLGSIALLAFALEAWVIEGRISAPRIVSAFVLVSIGASAFVYLAGR
jgi:hypothetical protein